MASPFGQGPPAVRSVDQSALWYGYQTAFGSLFGAQNIARDRATGGDSYRYTVIPLPVQPLDGVTLERLADAVATSLTGRLEDMVDVYRLTVERDGWMDSILRTMSHGLLGMPLAWQGDPEMCSALQDADGTPGDFAAMHPESECAKIFADGIGLGFGLGQYLLMCWRCKNVEWIDVPMQGANNGAAGHDQRCKTCGALRSQRPIGARELFQLTWRDARWLWRNPITLQWYYNGRQGMVPFNPGDGEWFLFRTVPDIDIWRNGPWTWGCVAAIMARDSRYDAANTSAVCAPTHVFQAVGPTAQQTRKQVDQEAKGLRFGNSLTLPGEWNHEIHAAKAEFMDVASKIQEDSTGMWEVGVTGNNHGMKAGPGFSNMDVYERVTEKRRAFYAGAWIRQVVAQGLVWWARGNFGPQAVCPVGVYDVKSPGDKLATVKALGELGNGVKALVAGLKSAGVRPTLAQVTEVCQRAGVRTEVIPGGGPQLFDLDPKDEIAGIKINEWRVDQGLPPVTDARGDMFMTASMKPGGDSTPVAAAPPGAAPVPAPAPGAPPPPAAPPDARLAEEDEDELDPDDEDDEDAARLAAEYTAAGLDRCPYHGRTHSCPRCGVRRAYGLDPVTKQPRVAWRPISRSRARLVGSPIDVALQRIAHADAVLEHLGSYDDESDEAAVEEPERARLAATARARLASRLDREAAALEAQDGPAEVVATLRARAEQLRGPDGRFISGGGRAEYEKQHEHAAALPKGSYAGSRDGLGRSRAAKAARSATAEAQAASAKAKAGGSHADAIKAHMDAAAQHREAASRSARIDYKAAHEEAAKAHEDAAVAHAAQPKPPAPKPKAAPKAAPKPQPPKDPAALKADVEKKVAALPEAEHKFDAIAVTEGSKRAVEHIKNVLPKMSDEERSACLKFSNGHDYEMRAMQRGVSKGDLVKSRMAANPHENEQYARAHVEESAKFLPHFEKAQEKLKTTEPPPPPLFRGMSASDRTVHELLTKKSFDLAGMSSSASLSLSTASTFADMNQGQKDYRGDEIKHRVILQINKGHSAPIMHSALSDFAGEREQVLPGKGKYTVTKRTRSHDGTITVHLEQR
jgi:hypothetical protein